MANDQAQEFVRVRYFAQLKEQSGCREENVRLHQGMTALELYGQLAAQHGFVLRADHLRVAIDDEFASMTHKLKGGETVVFIPPVAGG